MGDFIYYNSQQKLLIQERLKPIVYSWRISIKYILF